MIDKSAYGKFISERNRKLGLKVVDALKSRRFDAYYFDSPDDAVTKVFELIPKDDVISWGGSFTVVSLRLQEIAREKGYAVIDRDTAKTPEERTELMRKALTCGTFLSSANAISEDGELVNIDGVGNRVAAMVFGPRQVIVVAGMNKVAHTLQDAYNRVRTIAAPVNSQRFSGKTPCQETGGCKNCKSPDSMCSYIVTMRLCKPAGRIMVILIGEDAGF
jgi:L-lactate utilization protein LutB